MQTNYFNRVQIEIKKTYYLYDRYKFSSTFALLYHNKPIDVAELGKYIRMSDHIVNLDDNHYFINFAFTNQQNAFKASQNLLFNLDKHFQETTSRIAIDTFDIAKTPQMVINRLVQILEALKKHQYERIEDENILNEMI